MNRMELEKQIIAEGEKRKIQVVKCSIHDRGTHLDFYPEIVNEYANAWVNEYQVEELINDIAPLERPHKIQSMYLASRTFYIGENVEIDNVWIRLDYQEKEPKGLIKSSAGCGQYRQGWVKGKVVETPEQNDKALVVVFPRDIWIEKESKWWGDVSTLEKAIQAGQLTKIEKGQPCYCGTGVWSLRKVEE
jgi:hypothetical protein